MRRISQNQFIAKLIRGHLSRAVKVLKDNSYPTAIKRVELDGIARVARIALTKKMSAAPEEFYLVVGRAVNRPMLQVWLSAVKIIVLYLSDKTGKSVIRQILTNMSADIILATNELEKDKAGFAREYFCSREVERKLDDLSYAKDLLIFSRMVDVLQIFNELFAPPAA